MKKRLGADVKKFYDFLLRQGFSYDLVSSKMREIAKGELEQDIQD